MQNDKLVVKVDKGVLYDDYRDYAKKIIKFIDLYVDMREKYNIDSTKFFPNKDNLIVKPTKKDLNNDKFNENFCKEYVDENKYNIPKGIAKRAKKNKKINIEWKYRVESNGINEYVEPDVTKLLKVSADNITVDFNHGVVWVILDGNPRIHDEVKEKYEIYSYEEYEHENELITMLSDINYIIED